MDGGDVSVEGKVMCASWIKRPENVHQVVIEKSVETCSSLEIFSFNSKNSSLSSSPKDENIELCRFSQDGTKPFLFTTVQKGILKASKDGDVCVIDVTKMEISSLHKRLHLGTNITSLEFCPSIRSHIFHGILNIVGLVFFLHKICLPAPHFSYVKNINPGLLSFLFNYNNRELYGIYEAASSGKMNINPYGCTLDDFGRTEFSTQVLCHGFFEFGCVDVFLYRLSCL
ncbi:hypothetical protein H5410_005539 [Solanum commersonii]|uniref:DCD domain-containing protein n=1 Tax=Solanum commersonii TaxID=4109 RepID=A0A9J6A715_SOLCO|nr:hypothetical protein H5410_005539 [Solanum commersonii]